jgi:hypothetical protein
LFQGILTVDNPKNDLSLNSTANNESARSCLAIWDIRPSAIAHPFQSLHLSGTTLELNSQARSELAALITSNCLLLGDTANIAKQKPNRKRQLFACFNKQNSAFPTQSFDIEQPPRPSYFVKPHFEPSTLRALSQYPYWNHDQTIV